MSAGIIASPSKQLERLLPDWSVPLGAVYWVTPPEGPLPKRIEVLRDYLIEKLARTAVAEDHGRAASGKAMNR
jgi:DNA-binding transcriptional LysR family regulator